MGSPLVSRTHFLNLAFNCLVLPSKSLPLHSYPPSYYPQDFLYQRKREKRSRHNIIADAHSEDGLVDSWMLMSSPVTIMALVGSYLIFVIYIGPKMMENMKPYDLKAIMMPYNLVQVVYNSYLVILLFLTDGALNYLAKHYCQPMDARLNPLRIALCNAMWHYTFLKLLDLADTVFFVLRKKQDHVTFLHVYHHSVMALCSWATLKYLGGEQSVPLGLMNASIHVIMYTYYFLAALGDSVRKYLWWKRYLTKMQIGQFVIGVTYLSTLVLMQCDLPIVFTYFWASQICVFLVLFLNFYIKTYIMRPFDQKSKTKEH